MKMTNTCEINQEHEHELWWNACQPAVFLMADLTFKTMLIQNHELYYMVYGENVEGTFEDKMNWMYTSHILYV